MCHFAAVCITAFFTWAKSWIETSALLLGEALQYPKPAPVAHTLQGSRGGVRALSMSLPSLGPCRPCAKASKSMKRLSRVSGEHEDAPQLRVAHPQILVAFS